MRIYYAHCIAIYGTRQEERDLTVLESMLPPGGEVINPNNVLIHRRCEEIRRAAGTGADASQLIMDKVFRPLAEGCDLFVFRALPDGRIPASVMQELMWARAVGRPILELPSGTLGRAMSVESTREYLHEVGQR